jgi:hypothetical protein
MNSFKNIGQLRRERTSWQIRRISLSALLGILFAILSPFPAYAQSIEDIQILKISPQDERAVIKTPDGKMQIIKIGDILRVTGERVAGSELKNNERKNELRVVEITKGRVVFEEKTENGKETVIIKLEDGKQRIERIQKMPDKQPVLYVPK